MVRVRWKCYTQTRSVNVHASANSAKRLWARMNFTPSEPLPSLAGVDVVEIDIACFLSIFNFDSEMFSIDVINFSPIEIICLRAHASQPTDSCARMQHGWQLRSAARYRVCARASFIRHTEFRRFLSGILVVFVRMLCLCGNEGFHRWIVYTNPLCMHGKGFPKI